MLHLKLPILALCAALLPACATTYGSSCEELAQNQKSEIRKMVKRFESSKSRRHVLLLETGSGFSDLCRTHFLTAKEFSQLPQSAAPYCWEQQRESDSYCTIYSLDGEYAGESVQP